MSSQPSDKDIQRKAMNLQITQFACRFFFIADFTSRLGWWNGPLSYRVLRFFLSNSCTGPVGCKTSALTTAALYTRSQNVEVVLVKQRLQLWCDRLFVLTVLALISAKRLQPITKILLALVFCPRFSSLQKPKP